MFIFVANAQIVIKMSIGSIDLALFISTHNSSKWYSESPLDKKPVSLRSGAKDLFRRMRASEAVTRLERPQASIASITGANRANPRV